MDSPALGSLYSVFTFIGLGAAFMASMGGLFDWTFPSESRLETSVTALFFLASGLYAMYVGRHRDVTYFEALRRGTIDIGRLVRSLVLR